MSIICPFSMVGKIAVLPVFFASRMSFAECARMIDQEIEVKVLQIDRVTLYNKIKKYQLKKEKTAS